MLAISDLYFLFVNKAFFLDPFKKQIRKILVFLAVCCIIAVKFYMEILKIFLVLFIEFCNQFFRLNAKFRSLYFNRSPMSIISAAIYNIFAYKPQKPYKYVCLNIFYKVPHMDWPVCIRQCACYNYLLFFEINHL